MDLLFVIVNQTFINNRELPSTDIFLYISG